LESDIRKERNFRADEFIDDLKKEVEWHEEWVGDPVGMYILSKNPETISQEDYRRYLRQLSEKIKTSTQKIEKALASDNTGLQVTDEYTNSGRTIWYPKSKQDQMSEEELKTGVERQRIAQERFFDEKSNDYVGISEGEFRMGEQILKNIEVFLNKKPTRAKKEEVKKVSFGVKVGAFVIQWIWLFIIVSIALWLLSLIVAIIQYNVTFAFVASGILTIFFTLRQSR
jgi:hypothetical protein